MFVYVTAAMFSLFEKRFLVSPQSIKLKLRRYAKCKIDSPLMKKRVNFFSKLLEIPLPGQTKRLLDKSKSLFLLKEDDVERSFKYLINVGLTIEDIRKEPVILTRKDFILRNRHEILLELGFTKVNAFHLNKYRTLVNRNEEELKGNGTISRNIDVQLRLSKILNIHLNRCNERDSLKLIRLHILRSFFAERLSTTLDEFYNAINGHFLAHRSFTNIMELTDLLLNHLEFSAEDIKKDFSFLTLDANNVRRMISLEPIDGLEMREFLRLHPFVMKSNCDNILETVGHIRDFGIPESAIGQCPDILANVDPKTIYDRLLKFSQMNEYQQLKSHRKVLKLILYQPKVLARLDYLKVLDVDVDCHSVNLLSGTLPGFTRYIHNGLEASRQDNLDFLIKTFDKNDNIEELTKAICRHPHWYNIRVSEMKQTIDDLKLAGFELGDIYTHIQIVLYSSSVIFRRLNELNESWRNEDPSKKMWSKRVELKMILYLIEADFKFSGDGVWLERKRLNSIEL